MKMEEKEFEGNTAEMEMEDMQYENENKAYEENEDSTEVDSSVMSFGENWSNIWLSSDDDENIVKKGDIQDYPTIKDKIYECKTFAGYVIQEAYEGDKIKKGQRVVLSPEFVNKNENPDYKGRDCVGTVVKATDSKVLVLWDCGDEDEPVQYNVQDKMGNNVKDVLLLLDNAQTGAIHNIYECDECQENPIRGIKWRCLLCKDYDLCTRCYMLDKHNINHPFNRKLDNNSRSMEVGNRKMDSKKNKVKTLHGIFPGAKVFLRRNVLTRGSLSIETKTRQTGTVRELNDKETSLFNCDAVVKWRKAKCEGRYRVGREGRVELRCLSSGKGLMYYEDHLQVISKENAKLGMRVVAKYREGKKEQYVGTVISNEETLQEISEEDGSQTRNRGQSFRSSKKDKGRNIPEKDSKLVVQWDDGKVEHVGENKTIFLYDNSQIGIGHNTRCDECGRNIKGMRWKCETEDYDLCTNCYMSDEGQMDLRFYRMVDPSQYERLAQPRSVLASENKMQALGLFKGAEVCEIKSSNGNLLGTISRITDYKVNAGRNVVTVVWGGEDSSYPRNGWKITDLKCQKFLPTFTYYPAHLPKLQDDKHGYIKAGDGKTKISVDLWLNEENKAQLKQEKVTLYLLFARNPYVETDSEQTENESDRMEGRNKLLRNIKSISKKTGLPCLDILEKTLFFEDKVIIHQKTTPETIQMLIKMGKYAFERGDSRENENEIQYFQRMIEAHCGHVVLPVAISLGNGGFQKEVVANAVDMAFPIVSFKKSSKDAIVTLINYYNEDHDREDWYTPRLLATESLFDVKIPWKVKKEFDARLLYNRDSTFECEISSTDDIPLDQELDALVCCMVIAVCMAGRTQEKFKKKYANPLSMYLLKTGKWRIPKDIIKDFFNHRSIEFIFEKKMTSEFEKDLWRDLKESTNHAYLPPVWKGDKLKVSISGLFGLIFLALLKRKFYTGAKQFIETGCVHVHFILVGCVILQDAADDWRTSEADKDKFQIMIKKFTHQALRIISCIHESDKQKGTKSQIDETKKNENEDDDKKEIEADIQHAGRLLINHGYLSDGIRTENKVFLDNEVVKNILNQMWYGGEKLTALRVIRFVLLTMFHIILLPLLMITMEYKPFIRLYRQYKIPFMKVSLNVLSLFALLTGYAYMLLFDFGTGISNTDIFIISWMTSFFIDETKQVIVAVIRRRKYQYFSDPWNYLDWVSMITYICGMLMKLEDTNAYFNASKVLLVTAFIMFSIRILHMFSMSELLGPKLVIIRKMFLDTFALMAIMFVISMCYNISYYAILYSENSEFTFEQLEKITRNGYWMLFGELNLEGDKLTEPACTFNQTIYRAGLLERCPSSLGIFLAPYLKAVYVLIAVILLLNLLIAMYSHTFSEVHEKSKFYWSQLQTDFLEEFSVKSIFPVHMQLLTIPFFIIHAFVWLVVSVAQCKPVKCCNSSANTEDDNTSLHHAPYTHEDDIKKFNRIPMFVRVFIFDTNYDLKLKKTRKVEGQAALITMGEMDITEEIKIKELSKKLIRRQKKLQKSLNENIQKMQSSLVMKLRPESVRKSQSEESWETSQRKADKTQRRFRESAIVSRRSLMYESDSDDEDESDI